MTQTSLPSTWPWPVTTPSAGVPSGSDSPPRTGCWWARRPSSTNVPSSKSRSMRSRTVSLPRWCCLAIFSSPPMPRFLRRLPCSSATSSPYSSGIGGNVRVAADQEVLAPAPAVEEPVEVAFRQPLALLRLGPLPLAVLVLDDRQVSDHQRPASAVAQAKAELDVGDPVEAELGIEPSDRESLGAPECHAVALDGVDLGSCAFLELFDRPLAAHAVWPGDRHRLISQGCHQQGDGVAFQLDSRVEQHDDLTRRGLDARVHRCGKAEGGKKRDESEPLGGAALQPRGDSNVI